MVKYQMKLVAHHVKVNQKTLETVVQVNIIVSISLILTVREILNMLQQSYTKMIVIQALLNTSSQAEGILVISLEELAGMIKLIVSNYRMDMISFCTSTAMVGEKLDIKDQTMLIV